MILRLLGVAALSWSLSAVVLKITDGFTIAKIGEVFIEDFEEPPFDESLLNQPFFYMGKGGQSYTFVSEDQSLVLKLFRGSKLHKLQRTPRRFRTREKARKILESEKKIGQTLQSYAIARERFCEETGIIATHLSSTEAIATPITLIDRSKIKHCMDPNRYPFIIQKRATLVKQTIAQLMERGEVTAAKIALRSLFSLLKLKMERGIVDGDPNLIKNFGFLGQKPIQIDGGRFEFGLTHNLISIAHSQEDLQHWINKYYPELSEDFKSAYNEFLTQVL